VKKARVVLTAGKLAPLWSVIKVRLNIELSWEITLLV